MTSEERVIELLSDPENVEWLVGAPRALEIIAISLRRQLTGDECAELLGLTQGRTCH